MSGNRANAAAIQRRSTNPNQPQQQQQTQQQRPSMQKMPRNQSQNQSQINPVPLPQQVQTPKLSVSDAMALVSLRLGRVESFINAMPTLNQLISTCNGDLSVNGNQDEDHDQGKNNNRIIDEAVFTSIVSRLNALEELSVLKKTEEPSVRCITEDEFTSVVSRLDGVEKTLALPQPNPTPVKDTVMDEKVNLLSSQNDSNKTDIESLKTLFTNLLNDQLLLIQQLQEQVKQRDVSDPVPVPVEPVPVPVPVEPVPVPVTVEPVPVPDPVEPVPVTVPVETTC